MSSEEILATAAEAVRPEYQAYCAAVGKMNIIPARCLGDIIAEIKKLAVGNTEDFINPSVTVSVGERPDEDYRHWFRKGADRYLLKHGLPDETLYDSCILRGAAGNGRDGLAERIRCLRTLKGLGYEIGSGFMIGLPGLRREEKLCNSC